LAAGQQGIEGFSRKSPTSGSLNATILLADGGEGNLTGTFNATLCGTR